MTGKSSDTGDAPVRTEGSEPEVVVSYKPAGRETLEAITGELVPLPTRFEQAAKTRRESSSPEISVREGSIERDTLAAIMAEAGAEPAASELEIFELMTYVVRGGDVARLASESSRRSFVEKHLLARLPVSSMAEVERVDVTPWTVPGTLVVRAWCRTKR